MLANADEQEKASDGAGSGGGSGSSGSGSGNGVAQDLTDRPNGMTPEERQEYLGSEEFRHWALENPEAAKAAMDAAADSGLIDKSSEEDADFLSDYWNNQAMLDIGIDPASWDTSKGTEHNWETIKKVYDFYGQAYLSNPDLQWAGTANINTRDAGKIKLTIVAPSGEISGETDRIRLNTTNKRPDFSEVTYFLTAGSPDEYFELIRDGVARYGIDADSAERWIAGAQRDPERKTDFSITSGTSTGLDVNYDLRYDGGKDTQVIIVHVRPTD
ncbi:hypothetical protein [Pseudarthrobacter sp. MDT1-22]